MIMDTPDKVLSFLENCSNSVYNRAEADFNILKSFKKDILKSDLPLMQWDVPYLSGLVKKHKFDLNQFDYLNYFSLGSCMEGLNLIINSLYNVNMEVVPLESGESWCNDIYKLAVTDQQKNLLGYIYCDFYQR
jgi:intermediate peptidase